MPDPSSISPPSSLSDAISRLMENPEIISTVASALGNMSAQKNEPPPPDTGVSAEATEAEQTSTSPSQPAPDLSALATSLVPLMSGLGGGSRSYSKKSDNCSETERREALLCALKPYVSESRREAIDYIIRISRISELLKPNQSQ